MINYSRFDSECKRLSLKVLHNIRNGVPGFVEKQIYRNAFEFGVGERYVAGKVEIEFSATTRAGGRDYVITFVVSALKQGETTRSNGDTKFLTTAPNFNVVDFRNSDKSEPMFVRARDASKKSEEIVASLPLVPSRVRLVTFENWAEDRGDVLALILGDGYIEVVRAFPEREVSVSRGFATNQERGGAGGLIQGIPQVFYDIAGQPPYFLGDWFKSNFDFDPSPLKIDLFEHSCRVGLPERSDGSFQLHDVLFRPAR